MFFFCAAAAIFFVGFVFSMRASRHHAKSLIDTREEYRHRIATMESKRDEEIKEIPSEQQRLLLRSAVEDLIRLNGKADTYAVSAERSALTVTTPDDQWTIRFTGRETRLRTVRRTLHGNELWLLQGKRQQIQFDDIRDLMATLNAWMKGGTFAEQAVWPFSHKPYRHVRLNKPAPHPAAAPFSQKTI